MKNPSNHIPKMRFSEFSSFGPWKAQKLKSFLEPVSREVVKPTSKYLGLGLRSHGKGTFLKEDVDPEANSMERLYEVAAGDLIVNITFAWEGAIAIAGEEDDKSLVSHRFPTYKINSKKVLPGFLRHVIRRPEFVYSLGLISPGGAGRNRVMSKKDFLELSVLVPELPEQRRISSAFEALDNLIDSASEELESLKDHKQGLIQQLFPAEGESLPSLRFSKHRTADVWKQAPLESIIETLTPPRKIQTLDYLSSGNYPIVDQSSSRVAGWTDDPASVVYPSSPVIVFGDHTCELKLVDFPFAQGADGIKIIRSKDEVSEGYLYYYLQSRPVRSKEYKRHFSTLKSILVSYPEASTGEQETIAECFSSIDRLIGAAEGRLNSLKSHKLGLLQRLFPVLNEVDG